MREVLFRAKSVVTSNWVYGDLYTRGCVSIYANGEKLSVDEKTVGQYTGILDKNGARVFEGDIVECVSWNEYFSDPTTGKVMEPFRRKMEVVFMAGGFKLVEHLPQPCKDNIWDMIVEGDLIIIGNIHDNHELLT